MTYGISTACAIAFLNDLATGPVLEGEDLRYLNVTNLTNLINLTIFFYVIKPIQCGKLRSGWVLELLEAAGKNVRHNAGRNLEPWRGMNSAQSILDVLAQLYRSCGFQHEDHGVFVPLVLMQLESKFKHVKANFEELQQDMVGIKKAMGQDLSRLSRHIDDFNRNMSSIDTMVAFCAQSC